MGKSLKHIGQIADGRKTISRYLDSIGKTVSGLSPHEECRLTKLAKTGDPLAMNKLIESNLRFVISVAKEYQGNGLALEDLIAEGNYGLIKSIRLFDETRGFKLISYAVWWIRQSIMEAIAKNARVVVLPQNKIGDLNRITRAIERLDQKFGRYADFDEIAEDVTRHKPATYGGMTEQEVRDTLVRAALPLSLDEPFSNEEDSNNLHDVLPGNTFEHPGDSLEKESLRLEVSFVVSTLKPREAEVIRLYFGLEGERPLTLEEIGGRFKLTRERVRQIKEKALHRLRHRTRMEPLRKYLS